MKLIKEKSRKLTRHPELMLDDIDPRDFHKIRPIYWTQWNWCVSSEQWQHPWGLHLELPLLLLFLHYTTHDKLADKKKVANWFWKWRAKLEFFLRWRKQFIINGTAWLYFWKKGGIQRGWKVWAQGPVCKSLWRRPVRSKLYSTASSRPQECTCPAANVLYS